jgi:hypothetical protein
MCRERDSGYVAGMELGARGGADRQRGSASCRKYEG